MTHRVCFFGGARYREPLDTTDRKKFAALCHNGEIFVVGFAPGARPRVFSEEAHFYLLPELPLRTLRYLEMWIVGAWVATWLILRHGVQLIVAQGPYEAVAPAVVKIIAAWFGRRIFLVVEAHGDFEASPFPRASHPVCQLLSFSHGARGAFFSGSGRYTTRSIGFDARPAQALGAGESGRAVSRLDGHGCFSRGGERGGRIGQ